MNRTVVIDVLDDLLRLELEAVAHDVLTEQRNMTMLNVQHQFFFDKIWQSKHSKLYYKKDITTQISRSTLHDQAADRLHPVRGARGRRD